MNSQQSKDLLIINCASLLLAISPVAAHVISISSYSFIFGRSIIALPCVILACFYVKGYCSIRSFRHAFFIVLAGMFMAFHWCFFYESIKFSSVAIGVVIVHTYPLITSLLEPFFTAKRFSLRQLIESIVVAIGVWLMFLGDLEGSSLIFGVLIGLLGAFLLACRNILTKQLLPFYSPVYLMVYQIIIAIICLFPFGFRELLIADQFHWQLIVAMGIMISGLGHSLFVKSMQSLSATTVGLVGSFQIVYASVYAYLILDEFPSFWVLCGSLLIVLAVIVEQFSVIIFKHD